MNSSDKNSLGKADVAVSRQAEQSDIKKQHQYGNPQSIPPTMRVYALPARSNPRLKIEKNPPK